jgi:hypothetical protein
MTTYEADDFKKYSNLSLAFQYQAKQCYEAGSRFYGLLCDKIGHELKKGNHDDDENKNTSLYSILQSYISMSPQELNDAALSVRFIDALHYIVLLQHQQLHQHHENDKNDDTSLLYHVFPCYYTRHKYLPTTAENNNIEIMNPQYIETTVYSIMLQTLTTYHTIIQEYMKHEPQTNEPGRSSILLLGFLYVQQHVNSSSNINTMPIRSFEIGCSAGLNLLMDRYYYTYVDTKSHSIIGTYGNENYDTSTVHLVCQVNGKLPLLQNNDNNTLHIIERSGCDRRITNLRHNNNERIRLLSYNWADQFERFARCENAINMLLKQDDIKFYEMNGNKFLHQYVTLQPHTITILYHSIVFQYINKDEQRDILQHIDMLSQQATLEQPFAYIRMEASVPVLSSYCLTVTIWPSGEEKVICECQAHGTWLNSFL